MNTVGAAVALASRGARLTQLEEKDREPQRTQNTQKAAVLSGQDDGQSCSCRCVSACSACFAAPVSFCCWYEPDNSLIPAMGLRAILAPRPLGHCTSRRDAPE